MKQAVRFISRRFASIEHAIEGFLLFFKSETHAAIHAVATVLVITACFFFPVSLYEILILIVVTSMVWVAEMLNTAIERAMNFLSPQRSKEVKFIKDVSAGAVLVAAFAAVLAACIIFIPKI